MVDTQLTMDIALGLLNDFEEEEAVDIEFVGGGDDATALSLSLDDQSRSSSENRFKRARETKKNELAYFRTQASGLERVLRVLKQQQRRRLSGSRPGVWEVAARRQEQERIEAELLNAQLRAMVQATAKRARQLKSLLSVPDTLSALVHHKRLNQYDVASFMADAVELQGVTLAVDLLELQVATAFERFQDNTEVLKARQDGCGVVMELMDSSVLPFDASSVSSNAWQLLALGDSSSYKTPAAQDLAEDTLCQVSRMYTMEFLSGGQSVAYKGTYVYRKRLGDEGRLMVSWASSWTSLQMHASFDENHECFRREGFVVVSPSSDVGFYSDIQVFHRVERDACGDQLCSQGVWGYATAKEAELGVQGCVASEVKAFFQALENQIVMQGTLSEAGRSSKRR